MSPEHGRDAHATSEAEFGGGEFAVSTGLEVSEGERAEGRAVEREHGGAAGGEHAAHLVVFALDECELGFAGTHDA